MEQPKNNLKIIADKKNARVILPNMLTLIGVCIGLTSIRFALDGKFEFAIIAIIFAALIDGLDGRIARLIKGTSKVCCSRAASSVGLSPSTAPPTAAVGLSASHPGATAWACRLSNCRLQGSRFRTRTPKPALATAPARTTTPALRRHPLGTRAPSVPQAPP